MYEFITTLITHLLAYFVIFTLAGYSFIHTEVYVQIGSLKLQYQTKMKGTW